MDDTVACVEARIVEHRPGTEVGRGFGAHVQALAEARAALRDGAGSVFGLGVTDALLTARDRLEPLLGDALDAWETRLRELFGDEGAAAFETILGRFRLGPKPPARRIETAYERAFVARVEAQLAETDALTGTWRDAGRLIEPGDRVAIESGEPDPEGLDALADAYVQTTGAPFPPLLYALWSTLNGLAVFATDGASERSVVAPSDLSEPSLWPVDCWGDHWSFDDPRLFVIGELPDSGHLALCVADGDPDPEVVWIARRERPRPIAPSFSAFLELWSDAAFCVPLLLTRSGVPGWMS